MGTLMVLNPERTYPHGTAQRPYGYLSNEELLAMFRKVDAIIERNVARATGQKVPLTLRYPPGRGDLKSYAELHDPKHHRQLMRLVDELALRNMIPGEDFPEGAEPPLRRPGRRNPVRPWEQNPDAAWHRSAAKEYARKLKADEAAGHKGAEEYWSGALAAESRALALENPGVSYHRTALELAEANRDRAKFRGDEEGRRFWNGAAMAHGDSLKDTRFFRKLAQGRRQYLKDLGIKENPDAQGVVARHRLAEGGVLTLLKIGRSYTVYIASPALGEAPEILAEGVKLEAARKAYADALRAEVMEENPFGYAPAFLMAGGEVAAARPGEMLHAQVAERLRREGRAGRIVEDGFVAPDGTFLTRSQALARRRGNPRRPPRGWWYDCVEGVKRTMRRSGRLYDPRRVCGDAWYHRMTEGQRRARVRREEQAKWRAASSRRRVANPETGQILAPGEALGFHNFVVEGRTSGGKLVRKVYLSRKAAMDAWDVARTFGPAVVYNREGVVLRRNNPRRKRKEPDPAAKAYRWFHNAGPDRACRIKVPSSFPRRLWMLGRLHSIRCNRGRKMLSGGILAAGRFGRSPLYIIGAKMHGASASFHAGRTEYVPQKASRRHGAVYYHDHSRSRPPLVRRVAPGYYTVAGAGLRITRRGIVG